MIQLNNGVNMPLLGFGVFQITDHDLCKQSVLTALQTGYRLLDTAACYGNERAVGDAIRESGLDRKDVFVTSKVWIQDAGYEKTRASFEKTLENLQTDYLDLYLIHMPFGDYYGAWRAMEKLYAKGRVRAIGVCNFEPDRLLDLCHNANVIPAVNQIEVHPYTPQTDAIRTMQELGIQAEAWGPLAEGRNGLFTDDILIGIGRKYNKSAAQVVLRWHLQHGIVAIPKSVHRQRMEENFNIEDFMLTPEDMAAIASMNTGYNTILDLHAPEEVQRLYDIECPA